MSARHDENLVQVAVRQAAVEREVDQPCSACRVVSGRITAAHGQRDCDG
jgi:hypothetical protein